MNRCHACHAPIRWAITDHGLPIELDLDPSPNGTMRLGLPHVPGGTPRAAIIPSNRRAGLDGELYAAHQQTCRRRR